MTVEDAVVNTGATGLSLSKPLIKQLGLTPVRSRRAQTTNGIVTRTIYIFTLNSALSLTSGKGTFPLNDIFCQWTGVCLNPHVD